MPTLTQKMPDNIKYAVLGAIGLNAFMTLMLIAAGDMGLVVAAALAVGIYYSVYRNLKDNLTAAKSAATACAVVQVFFVVWSVFAGTMPFVLLNLAAAFCLGYASMQLQQLEKSIVAAPGSATPNGEPSGRAAQLRMLEELHASGVLTNEEFERKKQALG